MGPICPNSGYQRPKSFRNMRTSLHEQCEHFSYEPSFCGTDFTPKMTQTFLEREDDDSQGLSQNDEEFLKIISSSIKTNEKGFLEMPLPLKTNFKLPDNKIAVLQRTKNTLARIRREPEKTKRCVETMQTYINAGHVEEINPTSDSKTKSRELTNYIPVFPISHPKKDKIRLVFDSSATYKGVSLNDCVLQGPDEANKIIGVLLRFRHGVVGFSADIEMMYHSFYTTPEHTDAQRFFWWADNSPSDKLLSLIHI